MHRLQILNKEEKIAAKIALKSREDDVFLITPRGELFKLEKGMYGGWLLRPPLEELDVVYGVWCYSVERKYNEQVKGVEDIQEKVVKVASALGVNKTPLTSLVIKKFRVVKAVLKKSTERYAVYEIEPTDEEAAATLAYIHYYVWYSRRGKCHGEICGILDKFSKLLKAEFKEDAEVDEAGVYVPYDVSRLASVVAKLVSAAEEGVAEEAGRGGGAASAPTQEAEKTAYLIVELPHDSVEVITELEKAIRQKLKELNVEAEVQIREWSSR